MLLGQSLTAAIDRLKSSDVPSPRMNAELLLMFTLARDRAFLYGHPEYELTAKEEAQYNNALAQREQGIPAQYITGHQEFWGMDFIVTPAVLIPRPETEHVIETVLALVGRTFLSDRSSNATSTVNVRVIDVGTGSGCIALALAKELPQAELYATDISSAALEIARANAARHQLDSHIRFYETDLLAGMEKNWFDFVVSNPPYIKSGDIAGLATEVREHDPVLALDGGPDGLAAYRALAADAARLLAPHGRLVVELGIGAAAEVACLFSAASLKVAAPRRDLAGIPRALSIAHSECV